MLDNFTQRICSEAFLTPAQYKQIRYFQRIPYSIPFTKLVESSFNGMSDVDGTFHI